MQHFQESARIALLQDIATEQLRVAIWAFYDALVREEKRYNPSQPRVPRGNPDGGQWTRVGGALGDELGEETVLGDDEGEDRPITRQRGREPAPRSWARRGKFSKHYQKHNKDFGTNTPEEYAEKAQKFRRYAERNKLPRITTAKGYIHYYDPKTNTFGTYNPNGRTETFFKPTSRDKYFDNKIKEEIAKGGRVANYPPSSRRPRGGGGRGGGGGGGLWNPWDSNPIDDYIIY